MHTRSDLNIRNVRQGDLKYLLHLNQTSLPHVNSISLEDLKNFQNQSVCFRVAELKGKPAGFLIAFDPDAVYDSLNFLWVRERYETFVYIDRIIVAPEARRQGIAFRLYKDLEMFSRTKGIPIMTCEYNLRPENEQSRLFHEKYGFEEVGTQEIENGKKTVSLQVKQVDLTVT